MDVLKPVKRYENYQTFEASSEVFSGYHVTIDVNRCLNLDDIIVIFKQSLYKTLQTHNFLILLDKYSQCRFHMHDITIEGIRETDTQKTFYICDHC